MKLQTYALGAAILWAGIFLASAIVLQGAPYLSQMLPVLSGGAVWFVVIVPGARQREGARRENPAGAPDDRATSELPAACLSGCRSQPELLEIGVESMRATSTTAPSLLAASRADLGDSGAGESDRRLSQPG